jgi:hypothetical protein
MTENAVTHRSTLAEVLLASGRPHEAVEILEPVNKTFPRTSNIEDEPRMDLARALFCAARQDRESPDYASNPERQRHVADFRARGEALLSVVQEHQATFGNGGGGADEIQLYLPIGEMTRAGIEHNCHSPLGPRKPQFVLSVRSADAHAPMCGLTGVSASLKLPQAGPVATLPALLWIWGTGVDTLVTTTAPASRSGPADVYWLSPSRKRSHDPYYVQVIDSAGRPLSTAVRLPLQGGGRCGRKVLQVSLARPQVIGFKLAGDARASRPRKDKSPRPD